MQAPDYSKSSHCGLWGYPTNRGELYSWQGMRCLKWCCLGAGGGWEGSAGVQKSVLWGKCGEIPVRWSPATGQEKTDIESF